MIITVYGISQEMAKHLNPYLKLIINSASNLGKDPQLQACNISCFFPQDMLSDGLGEEIIIFVDGLVDSFEGPEAMKNRLAKALVDTTNRFFKKAKNPDLKKVECFVRYVDPREGYAYLNR